MRTTSRAVVAALVVTGALIGAPSALAQEGELIGRKVRTGDVVVVGPEETVEGDVYAFAADVRVEGEVTGDLIAASGTVSVSGTVGGDLMAAAGAVNVSGTVGGDARLAAGQVDVAGVVGEDLLATTGPLRVEGEVGGDLLFATGQTTLAGRVNGDVLGTTGSYTSSGTIGGTETVTIQERPVGERPNPLVRGLRRFAALLVFGLALMWGRRRWVTGPPEEIDRAPGAVIGWGVVFLAGLVAVPLAAVLVGAVVALILGLLGLGLLVGLVLLSVLAVLAMVALVAFVVIAFVAPVVTAVWLAGLFLPRETGAYLVLAVGLVILVGLGLIPFLGPLVGVVVTVLGAGAIIRSSRAAAGPVAPVQG